MMNNKIKKGLVGWGAFQKYQSMNPVNRMSGIKSDTYETPCTEEIQRLAVVNDN